MTEEQRIRVHQLTGAEALELIIPAPLRASAMKASENLDYITEIAPLLPIYEGLHSLLEYCKAEGIYTGIHTNRIIAMQEILEMNKLDSFFNPVMTPAVLPAKPNPIGSLSICKEWGLEVHEVIFVGDSDNDRKTAAAANIFFFAFKNPELVSQNHFSAFIDLENWLKSF